MRNMQIIYINASFWGARAPRGGGIRVIRAELASSKGRAARGEGGGQRRYHAGVQGSLVFGQRLAQSRTSAGSKRLSLTPISSKA